MSQCSKNSQVSHQNGRDTIFKSSTGSVNMNNNDSSFVSAKYNTSDKRIGDQGFRTDATTSTIKTNNNYIDSSRTDMILASPISNASIKDLKKDYHLKKKYFTKNIQSAIDSAQEVHSGWLKARTTFKRWTKTWCQVKPGYLILYTSQEAQKKHRLGVVLLSVCQVIKRPTKKDGFCFKLINPFGCSVWAKSSTRAIVFAQASLTLRVSDDSIGKLWLDALHRCYLSSNLDGYQPIIDDEGVLARGSGANSRLDDMGDSSGDDGEHSTRNLEYLLNHSNSTSDNNSLSSMQRHRNNNHVMQQHNGHPMSNGNTRMKQSKSELSHLCKFGEISERKSTHDNNSNIKQNNNNNVIQSQLELSSTSQLKQLDRRRLVEETSNNLTQSKNSSVVTGGTGSSISLNCSKMVAKFSKYSWKELQLECVSYIENGVEELGTAGIQSEEVHESNKNFLWHIIKQLRPGMDLSKVTLPTFILEPRSFLEKLADYYYHCDILSEAVLIDDPVARLINIVKWYLSGFYKKPRGPKKPYNPILGERFRCFWEHPKTKSRTFFIAEQVSHHPPISAFHVTNRKDGYSITCALLSRSKYGGNSVSAILDGKARLHLTKRNETYTITMPYANCRGILLGSLCMELGGKVEIECTRTNCKCELDFKLASMWASQNSYNTLVGKIYKDNKITHTLDGHWDKKINIMDKTSDTRSTLWEVTDLVRNSRLKRYTVSLKDQGERESVKLWSKVTEALIAGNQVVATAEKTKLEDMQRKEARERQSPFTPKHFLAPPSLLGEWSYKWQDDRPWDDRRDIMQFEEDFRIKTLMLTPTDASAGQTAITDNDLLLTQLSRFASQVQELAGSTAKGSNSIGDQSPTFAYDNGPPQDGLNEEAVRSLESRIAAGNQHFELALRQVNERNRKLEEDVASLKRARGKRTLALFMTAIVIALISAFYKYLP